MNGQQISDKIQALLLSTGRKGIDSTLSYPKESDFFRTGCHTHHKHPGGLAEHSLGTCMTALGRAGDLPRESVILASLLHDVCSTHSRRARGIRGHGRRSVDILEKVCGLELTAQEREAILLHMHYGAAPGNRLADLVFRADKADAVRGFLSL